MKHRSVTRWMAAALSIALGTAPLLAQVVPLSGEATGFSTGPDETPDSFAFAAIAGAEPGTVIVAPTFTLAGIDVPVTASVSGDGTPSFRVNGGSLVTSATVSVGDTISLSLETAAASYATGYLAALTIGTETENFSVTTRAQDSTPDAFTIAAATGVSPATVVLSQSVRISGLLDPAMVSISGQGTPEFSTNSGQSWVAAGSTGSISNNGQVLVRLTSGAAGETRTASLTVGGVSADFAVSTIAADTTPDDFLFAAQTGVEPATLTVSSPVTVSGINSAAEISVSGQGAPEFSTDSGFTWTAASGTISNGQQVLVRLTSGALGETRTATVTIGGVAADFAVSTRLAPTPPDAFTITPVTNATPNALVVSDPVTITGLTADVPVSVSGEGSPEFSTDGGSTWKPVGNTGTVSNNGTVKVRLTAGGGSTTRTATLSVGGVTGNFLVTTRAYDSTPDAYAFTAVTNAEMATMVSSNIVTLSGLLDDAPVTISSLVTAQFRINGGAWTSSPSSISNGQTLQVRVASSGSASTQNIAQTSVGGVTSIFRVTTKAADPCDSPSVTVGTTCADGAVYAGLNSSGAKFFMATSNLGAKAWKTTATDTAGAVTTDGWLNQKAIEQVGLSSHPGAAACAALGPKWYLPSQDELALFYERIGSYITPGTYYMTSEVFHESPVNGAQGYMKRYVVSTLATGNLIMTTAGSVVQCARHDGTRTYTDPCGADTPALGALCLDGSIYAGKIGARKVFMASQNQNATGATIAMRTTRTAISGTTDQDYGYNNTLSMTAGGSFPAADSCRARGADWYIPARNELALLTDNTVLYTTFSKTGNSNSYHWSSTQHTTTTAQYARGLAGAETGYYVETGLPLRCFKSSTVVSDFAPNAFSFTSVGGAALDTLTISDPVTISGMTASAGFTLTGQGSPEISINGGAYVTSGTISNGQTIRMRITSAAVSNVTRTATLTIGGVSGSFAVSTGTADKTPDSFSFTPVNSAAQGQQVSSGTVTISGINLPAAASITGEGTPTFSVNGGPWVSSGSIAAGDTLQVRLTSASSGNVTRTATMTVGGVSASFTVTTAYDSTPDAFSFVDKTGVEPNTTVSSAPVTISGMEVAAAVTASNGAEIRIDGGAWGTSGSVSSGQTLEVRLLSGSYNTTTSSVVTVGTVTDTFSVTARDGDALPDPFTIANVANQEPNSYATSSTVTLTGFEVAQIGVTSGSAQISINGGAYGSGGTILNGQTVTLRVLTGYAGETSTSTIRIQNNSAVTQVSFNWSASNRAPDGINPFTFDWGYSYCSNNLCTATSNVVTLSGTATTPKRLTIPYQTGNKNSQLYNYPGVKINGGEIIGMSTINSGNYTVLPGDTLQMITWPEPGTTGETRQILCAGEACGKYRWSNSYVYSSDPRTSGAGTPSNW